MNYAFLMNQIELEIGRSPSIAEVKGYLMDMLFKPPQWLDRCEGCSADHYFGRYGEECECKLLDNICHPCIRQSLGDFGECKCPCLHSLEDGFCNKCGLQLIRPIHDGEGDFDSLNDGRYTGLKSYAKSTGPQCSVKTVRGHQCTFRCQPGRDKCKRHLQKSSDPSDRRPADEVAWWCPHKYAKDGYCDECGSWLPRDPCDRCAIVVRCSSYGPPKFVAPCSCDSRPIAQTLRGDRSNA